MKLVLDMNLPPSWVAFLSGHGFEAVHWSSVGDGRATDREIMQWALDNLAANETPERILEQFPSLRPEHIPAAICYAAELARERINPISG